MLLKKNDLEKITFGALKITENEGHFDFFRFAPEQVAVYEREAPRFAPRTESSTCVQFDFYTDAESFSFSYSTESRMGPLINYAFIDVWVDGMMVAHEGRYHNTKKEGRLELTLPKGEKHLTVYFPCFFRTTVWDVSLPDGASVRPANKKYKVLMLGDSITHGAESHFPSLTSANTVIRELGFDAVCQAIGGEVFRPSILGDKRLFNPDIITVALGANDWNGVPDGKRYFEKLSALYPNSRIIYVSPIWSKGLDEHCLEAIDGYEAAAREHGAEVIHGLDTIPHLPEMFTDGEHPSTLGFTLYSKALLKAFRGLGVK